jgi:hypothetical protein
MTISFTRITCGHGPLTKILSINDSGSIQKKAAAHLSHGTYAIESVADLHGLSLHLEAATPDVAFTYGVPDQPGGSLVREEDLARHPDAIARTRNYFGWSKGPGILMLDNDNGQEFENTFAHFLWETVGFLEGVNMLVRPSSSSNLYHVETGACLRAMVNQRAYALVSDASLIPAIGQAIEAQLWLFGNGYYDISSAGTLLKRCTVDTSVWQPERLDFVGGAICMPPLGQRDMSCKFVEGYLEMVDAHHLPTLSRQDEDAIHKLVQQAKADVEVERQRVRAEWVERRTGDLVKRGADPDKARQSVQQAAEMQTLGGDFVITLQGGAEISIAELLAYPDQYHGQRCHDPLEPEYRNDNRVAFISLKNGGHPYIYSHAHGGCRYTLKKPPKIIQIFTGESARCTDELSKYLSEQGEIYERGQALLDIQHDGQTRVLNPARIKYLAGSACSLVRFDSRAKELRATDLTDTIAQLILSRGGHGTFRELAGVITAPTMTHEGRIISTPGYDSQTGLLLLIDGESHFLPINRQPNTAAIQSAFAQLWEPVKDFPFDGDVSRSCQLAAMLTSVVRSCLPTAPGFGLDAPTPASGKTKLAQCIAALGTGRVESLLPPPTEDEETRKKIATALAKGKSVVIFDNMETQLKSPVLAAFLTSPRWSDRLLGGNTEIEADNRMLVLITGNNLAPVGDIVRRLLTIRIDPQLEASEVWKREFAVDPLDYIVRNRQRLVVAALTLLSGYIAAGRPKPAAGRLASFEQWDDLIRQTVVWLSQQGIPGLCDPTARLAEAAATDPDALRLAFLAQQWHGQYGSTAQPLNQVIGCGNLADVLKEVAADPRGFLNVKILAAYLRKRIGKIVDGFRFERLQGRSNTALWRVVVVVPGGGGFGGFGGPVSADSAKDAIKITYKNTLGKETGPSNPPNPPEDDDSACPDLFAFDEAQ